MKTTRIKSIKKIIEYALRHKNVGFRILKEELVKQEDYISYSLKQRY